MVNSIHETINSVIAGIKGFTGYKELLSLYLLIDSIKGLDGEIVEVGSWCGRSSVIMAMAANTNIFCIDLFPNLEDWRQNDNGSWFIKTQDDTAYTKEFPIWNDTFINRFKSAYEHNNNLLDIFLQNIRRYNLEKNVTPIKGTLGKIDLPFSSIKFGFIDGDHDYKGASRDIKILSDLLVSGGIICVDDVRDDFIGVTRAVDELIINNNNFFNVTKITRKLLVATKK